MRRHSSGLEAASTSAEVSAWAGAQARAASASAASAPFVCDLTNILSSPTAHSGSAVERLDAVFSEVPAWSRIAVGDRGAAALRAVLEQAGTSEHAPPSERRLGPARH